MIASYKEGGDTTSLDALSEDLDEPCGLLTIFGVADAVSIEYRKVILYALDLLEQRFEKGGVAVEVIEDDGSEVLGVGLG